VYAIVAAVFPILVLGNAEIARNLVYFAFGVLVPTQIGSACSDRLNRVPFLVLVCLFLFARRIVPIFEVAILVQAVLGFAVLSRAYYASPSILNGPAAQFLGRISYSFYLWNMLFVNLLAASLERLPAWLSAYPVEAGLPISVAFGLATVPIAMASERWIERPGIAAGRAVSLWIVGRSKIAA
jgi:peptidoglycan/LPS O-acetylase OafA/YrhL